MANVHFVDPQNGDDANDGKCEARPVRNYRVLDVKPGDSVLFRRGAVTRDMLSAASGEPGKPCVYGAYGDGPMPVFLGSAAIGAEAVEAGAGAWTEESPSVWRWSGAFDSEPCNLVFDGGSSCGKLRWTKGDLAREGDWHFTRYGSERKPSCREGVLYLRCGEDPAKRWTGIECSLWGRRRLASGRSWIVFEGLSFRNAGVHGYQESRAEHVTIRNCEFRFIGGSVWDEEARIRFGNAVEFWDGCEDVEVLGCSFHDVYDAGVTHQGSEESGTPRRVAFRGNTFVKCGLAAYECRGPAAEDVYFERNVCVGAGTGFSEPGDGTVRGCEHGAFSNCHVMVWRIDPGTQKGSVFIRGNTFDGAPLGAVVCSSIDPEDEKRFVVDGDRIRQPRGAMLAIWGGRRYRTDEFEEYRRATGHEREGTLEET